MNENLGVSVIKEQWLCDRIDLQSEKILERVYTFKLIARQYKDNQKCRFIGTDIMTIWLRRKTVQLSAIYCFLTIGERCTAYNTDIIAIYCVRCNPIHKLLFIIKQQSIRPKIIFLVLCARLNSKSSSMIMIHLDKIECDCMLCVCVAELIYHLFLLCIARYHTVVACFMYYLYSA